MPKIDAPHHAVVGGGFYGCALALFLRSTGARVSLFEAGPRLMERASYANQARVHTGFHYPRSLQTAAASLALHQRFAHDFRPAIFDRFRMLYAIAHDGSKVSAEHFWKVFSALGAPIREAPPADKTLFDSHTIAGVFAADEAAFDARILRALVVERMEAAGIEVHLHAPITRIAHHESSHALQLLRGEGIVSEADRVFVALYEHTNGLLAASHLPPLGIKNERAEICLITPPTALDGKGITVMDGPFFSCMPFPSAGLYSLTHVRYTPRSSWTPPDAARWPDEDGVADSRFPWMVRDAARYTPVLRESIHRRSLFVTKAVLLRNERDDGRPIALHTCGAAGNIHAVLGGKIDNIYDLFDGLRGTVPELQHADTRLLGPAPPSSAHNA